LYVSPLPHLVRAKTSMKSIPKNKNSENHKPNNFAMAFKLELDPDQPSQKELLKPQNLHCGLEQSI
jgi:hypothetical protein